MEESQQGCSADLPGSQNSLRLRSEEQGRGAPGGARRSQEEPGRALTYDSLGANKGLKRPMGAPTLKSGTSWRKRMIIRRRSSPYTSLRRPALCRKLHTPNRGYSKLRMNGTPLCGKRSAQSHPAQFWRCSISNPTLPLQEQRSPPHPALL